MLEYNQIAKGFLKGKQGLIADFMDNGLENLDAKTVDAFSQEWTKFSAFDDREIDHIGKTYFDLVTDKMMHKGSVVLDMGCGTGRWTRYIADKVNFVEAIDPGDSVYAAMELLKDKQNVRITKACSDNIPFHAESFDFVFSLGVLHHIPDTQKALQDLIKQLKPGGYALLYFYYNLENRGIIHKALFSVSNILRKFISGLPSVIKKFVCDVIAFTVYVPFVAIAKIVRAIRKDQSYQKLPLAYYVDKSIHVIRNDSLDRFGTPLEKRFSRKDIISMCEKSGLSEIQFSEQAPYWHLVAKKDTQ